MKNYFVVHDKNFYFKATAPTTSKLRNISRALQALNLTFCILSYSRYVDLLNLFQYFSYNFCPDIRTDPCAIRTTLTNTTGEVIRSLCMINTSATWYQARQECLDLGYSLFVIDSASQTPFLNLLKFLFPTNVLTTFWVNGYIDSNGKWKLVDPNVPYALFASITRTDRGICMALTMKKTSSYTYPTPICTVQEPSFWCQLP